MRIGVDLGGTKTEAIAIAADGQTLARRRLPTPKGDYPGTIEGIAILVDGLVAAFAETHGTPAGIGVGIPGAVSPATGLIKNANSTWLIGKPFDRDLEARLGRPVRLANDADCLALSEASDGAAAGRPTVFAAILGTGVGGGLTVHGHLVTGPNAIAGEWGHNPLPWPVPDELPGPTCYCGKTGCIETWLSGPGFASDQERATGTFMQAEEIVAAALAGDATAAECLERYCDRLARALASVINIFDPHAIVLGGGLSNVAAVYERVPALWDRYCFSDTVVTPLLKSQHGDSSGVRGAAWLWPENAR